MFDLADRPLVFIPVKWTELEPGPEKNGEPGLAVEVERMIEVEVEILDRETIRELFEDRFGEDETTEGAVVGGTRLTGRALEAARFLHVVKRWRKVANNRKPLELNPENVKLLLSRPGFAAAFENHYLTAVAGKADIRKGN